MFVSTIQPPGQPHAEHRDERNAHRHQVDPLVELNKVSLWQPLGSAEDIHIHQCDRNPAADDRHTAKRLHGRVHQLACLIIKDSPLVVDTGNGLDRHGISHRILDDIPDGGQ